MYPIGSKLHSSYSYQFNEDENEELNLYETTLYDVINIDNNDLTERECLIFDEINNPSEYSFHIQSYENDNPSHETQNLTKELSVATTDNTNKILPKILSDNILKLDIENSIMLLSWIEGAVSERRVNIYQVKCFSVFLSELQELNFSWSKSCCNLINSINPDVNKLIQVIRKVVDSNGCNTHHAALIPMFRELFPSQLNGLPSLSEIISMHTIKDIHVREKMDSITDNVKTPGTDFFSMGTNKKLNISHIVDNAEIESSRGVVSSTLSKTSKIKDVAVNSAAFMSSYGVDYRDKRTLEGTESARENLHIYQLENYDALAKNKTGNPNVTVNEYFRKIKTKRAQELTGNPHAKPADYERIMKTRRAIELTGNPYSTDTEYLKILRAKRAQKLTGNPNATAADYQRMIKTRLAIKLTGDPNAVASDYDYIRKEHLARGLTGNLAATASDYNSIKRNQREKKTR